MAHLTMESSDDDSSANSDEATNPSVFAAIARRRFAAAIMATDSKPSGPKTKPNRKDWKKHVLREGPRKFRKMYRLDIHSFNHLVGLIGPRTETDET